MPQPCPRPIPQGWPWRPQPARAASLPGWELLPVLRADAAGPSVGDGGGCGCREGIAWPRAIAPGRLFPCGDCEGTGF